MDTYKIYLIRTLDLELMRMPVSDRLSDQYDLSNLVLREETVAGLDALYARYGWHPKLSKMIRLGASDLPKPVADRLDSLYDNRSSSTLSDIIDLPKLGVPQAAHARLDYLYEKSGRSYRITTSSKLKKPEIDTTGGSLVIRLPVEEGTDMEGQLKSIRKTQKLSEMVDLSELDQTPEVVAHLDSLYENRQPLKLSQKLDLVGLGLPQAVQAKLDSIYAIKKRSISALPHRIDLAEKKLKGRVLYWFLAGELIRSFEYGGENFELVRRKWRDFRATNPYPEYNAAVQAAVDRAMALRPGRPAPDFTLTDLDGQPVSLSQFRGKVVLLDFWASWCGPCIGNLPYIRELKKKTTDLPVVFVNLSLDSSDAAWRKAIDKHGIKGVHVRSGVWGSGTTSAYNVRAIPAYFLVDPQGIIVERLSGVRDTDAIVAKILKSLGSV
ncbi:MAG: TlpA family protein disulfide reductase [Candidatus Latescibacteria bacterium]|nr:TlpA family protein disulfide reductase [Candidatus Latescibacterota bacterium]